MSQHNRILGQMRVVDVRWEALHSAIVERNWEQVEFQYDRVGRALDKLERTVKGGRSD